ncbi:MAG: ATP-binding protein [Pseudomonadota bacterium]
MKETQQIEWKETWRDEILKWICGFANAEGGVLHIGRNDQGVVVGVPDAERLLEEIPNRVRDILGIIVEVNLREEGGKEYLEIVVEAYPYPVSYKGEYHLRSGSTKQELKGAALSRFLLAKQGLHWDGVPIPRLTLGDCSPAALQWFRDKAAKSGRVDEQVLADSDTALVASLQLDDGEHLKRAAALLFGKEPERFVPGAFIKLGFFITDDDLRYQDEIHGDLFLQVEKTLDILRAKYLKAYISYEGLQRVETFLFPMPALREALLNAVMHKDYSSGIPIQISVYEHQIVLWNAGQLPERWTLEKLLDKHPSHPFNPLLASAFFRAGYVESWGRGIEKIRRECANHDAPAPLFDTSMSGLMLTFKANPVHLAAALGEKSASALLNSPGEFVQPESRPESQPESQPESLELRVLATLVSEALSKAEISSRLGQKEISGQLNKVIRLLLADRNIEYTIPGKPSSRLQKYRLTNKGRAVGRIGNRSIAGESHA